MGSFAYTCAVSGLPIEAGDKVRYLLLTKNPYHNGAENTCYIHDLWFPRVFPLKGEYNDYGSVENVIAGSEQEIWLDGLKLDLVELGWGENTVHDVPTKKEMTFDELLNAIQEGRVLVEREYDKHSDIYDFLIDREPKESNLSPEEKRDHKISKGVPTIFRVQKVAERLGIAVYSGDWNKKSIVIDSPQGGDVRVRCHLMYGKEYNVGEKFSPGASVLEEVNVLEKLQAELLDYATVISASSNGCGIDGKDKRTHIQPNTELIIRPKPGTLDGTLQPKWANNKTPLPVGHAMIREDVWQEMLKGTVEVWTSKHIAKANIDTFYDGINKFVEYVKSEDKDLPYRFMHREDNGRDLPGAWIASKDVIPFTVGLATHFNLMMNKSEQPDEFFKTVAEFAFINCLLAQTRYQWRPSSSAGPQFGEWDAHEKLLKAFAKIATTIAKEQKEERAKWND
jgi:hypothetical protein